MGGPCPSSSSDIKQLSGTRLEGRGGPLELGRCLPVSHASPEPAGFLSRPVGGRGAPPSSPSCSRSFCPWRDSLATSSAAVQLSDFVATLSPASQALPAPALALGALPGPTHIPSALVCAWLRRATCPPTVHLHSVPSRPRPFTLTFPSLPRPGSSSRLFFRLEFPTSRREWVA
ncbi:unnamed protein product [Rangifer tarandus platyrhynchus]|uniref:Uncharacterized protein n=2 Tax=Rangifer tarandus platyrhynchus TaxID=3082113 RepID=A0AC59Z0V2_RANTA|nr:unnamed protein product [Rangifer tarandus platyrhynchus]